MAVTVTRAFRAWIVVACLVAIGLSAALVVRPSIFGGDTHNRGVPEDRLLGSVDGADSIDLSLALRLPGRDELLRFLDGLHTPGAPEFRHYLTAAEFGSRFGLPDAQLSALESELSQAGISIVERFPQRTSIRVRASAATVEAVFGVRLTRYEDETGREYRRPDRAPDIPPRLTPFVQSVSGLDTSGRRIPRQGPLFDVPARGLMPTDIERAFGLTRLRQATDFGAGEYIAVISFDTFDPADIARFDAAVGITSPPVEKIPVSTAPTKPGQSTVEVNLDIDIVRMIAPKAQILNFETVDYALTNGEMVRAVVADGRAKIATISWGWCASWQMRYFGADALIAEDNELKAAVAAGVNVFLASGDSGPYSCRHNDMSEIQLDPDATGSSPNIIAVGGTTLSVREDGSYLEEVAWEWPLRGEAGGGGQTNAFPREAWQAGPGVDNAYSNGFRQSPDVSGPADCDSGFFIVYTDPSEGLFEGSGGCGTSAASPFWAGVTVLLQRYARDRGIDELGYLNPTFYALAAEYPPNTIFHDIVRGANLGFDATPGWDFATGLGSPIGDALADALVEYLSR